MLYCTNTSAIGEGAGTGRTLCNRQASLREKEGRRDYLESGCT